MTLNLLNIHTKSPKISNFFFDRFFDWFICIDSHVKNIQVVIFINFLVYNSISQFATRCKR